MKQRSILILFGLLLPLVLLLSCEKILPQALPDNSLLDGPVDGLNGGESIQFLKGDVAFNDEVFDMGNGLGPLFVSNSCGSCHAGDGKGHPFSTLTRFGQSDTTGNKYLHIGGPQLQHRSLPGYPTEKIPLGATSARFTPPANTGLGFLELVSDADILLMADPNDADGDNISGVPSWNYLPNYLVPSAGAVPKNGKYIHRFGKKAGAYNLLQQTVNAYNQDMGINSIFEPVDTYSGKITTPEVSETTINDVVFYLQTLKAPIQRNSNDPDVMAGATVFVNIGCGNCHKPNLKTQSSTIAALSNKIFHPYTDMLLHDMGAGLDDGYTEGSALSNEWRTPPLWGLGLSPNSQGGAYFLMHDGRAKSIESAIIMHGGEGIDSRNLFQNLNAQDKKALLKFLESL